MPATVNERAALRTTLFKRNGPAIPLLANARTLARMIATIFGTNDNGVFYDPLDLNSVYQDAAGTSAVSASMQPLGLVLDKSKALKIGDELIPLPLNFNGWTKTAAVTATTNNSFTTSGAGGCTIPIFGSSNTRTYQIRLKGNSTVGGNIRSGGAGSNAVAIPIGNFDIVTTNPAIAQFSQSLYLALNTAGTLTIDSISVKEVMGNHAYQTTSAARPIFRQVATLGAELANNTAWKTGSSQNPLDILPDGRYRVTCQSTSEPRIGQLIAVTIGKTYEFSVDVEAVNVPVTVCTLMANYARAGGITFETVPAGVRKTVKGTFVATSITEQIGGTITSTVAGVNTIFGAVSVKEVLGYSTDRNFIEYDSVDDKLLTTFAAPLTNCTVVRAVPNEGTKILYNQTLPASYESTMNHSGFFAINRALSNSEKVLLLNEMDKRTGVTSGDSQVARSFANNEVGVAFNDFNDLSVLYQDAAGTVPVTAVGQPVGLMLDKSKGLVLSDELTTNGNFSQGLAGHFAVKGTQQLVAGKLQFTSTPNNDSSRTEYTFTGLTVGRWYEVAITARCVTTPTGNELIQSSDGFVVSTTATPMVLSATMKVYTYRLLASATSGVLRVYAASGLNASSATIEIEKYSIRELAGNHAYQTVSASRPLLQATPILGTELWNKLSLSTVGESSVISQDIYRIYSATGNYSAVTSSASNLTTGKTYEVTVNVDSITTLGSGIALEGFNDKSINSVGKYKFTLVATNTKFSVKRAGLACDIQVSGVSVKEIAGYHTDKNYLAFDGTDDFLQTNNIDFTSTDKVSVFAGVRKLSDAGLGILAELSTNTSSGTGNFLVTAPTAAGATSYGFRSKGLSGQTAEKNGYISPHSAVITGLASIPESMTKLRINGAEYQNTSDQGGGNYSNAPLYIGRRGGVSLPFNGHLYSLIIMGRLASDAETTTLEKAIAKQVGVTL